MYSIEGIFPSYRNAIVDNPPADLDGSLQVGNETSGTTTETVTETRILNGVSGNPMTQSTAVTITQRVVARSQVIVPAGTFDVWLIRLNRSDQPGYVEYAYSETVRESVMITVYDAMEAVRVSFSLTRYQTQAGPSGGAPVGFAVVALASVGATAVAVSLIVWWDRLRRRGIPAPPPVLLGRPPTP